MAPSLEKLLEEQDEAHRQLDDLLNLSLIKRMIGIGGPFDELRLRLKIAKIVGIKPHILNMGLPIRNWHLNYFHAPEPKMIKNWNHVYRGL
ncbi:MAG TPA: hypothetical protein VFJ51_03030 [Nitrososphaeraceae archaeon]|nr:hypothetical protein [Nitrososphaeraceae archaeon]